MNDSLDRHVEGSTTRGLLRRFVEVMDMQDTPTPFRTRRAAAKNTSAQSANEKRSRTSRQSTGGKSMDSEVFHQSKQSSSFMNQSLNVSVIQGGNQTYANIVAPDSDSSSLITSPDIKKASKWHTKKKRKMEDASLPADVVPKPPSKKRSKKTVLPPPDTSTAAISKEAVSGDKDTTYILAEEAQTQTKGSSTAGDKSHVISQKVASPKGEAEKAVRGFTTLSPNVSSISALSAESDGTYNFTLENDDTLSNIVETRERFGNQITSRKLNLPSIVEVLQTKHKSTESGTVADVGDALVASDLQAPTPVKSLQTSHEVLREPSKFDRTSQSIVDDFIPPPLSFRDGEISTMGTVREANFSNDLGENTLLVLRHQEQSVTRQDTPPVTPLPMQEDTPVDLQSASTGQRKNVGQVSVATTTTPTRSSLRKSVGQVSVATSMTPTMSPQRKSVGEVVATPTPTRSSLRKSVGEVNATTTPSKSAQKKSVGEVIATTTPIN